MSIATLLEKFLMFKCPTCGTAKDVWYDTKGEHCHEDIYSCQKCGYSFIVSAICDKCGSLHSRVYGCNNQECGSEDYHYNRDQEQIEKEL